MAQVEFEVPGPGTYLIDADPSLPALSNPGQASDVLAGEQFYDEDGNPVTGTMPSNPTEAIVIPGGGSYTIPQGYHTGHGTVTSSGSVLPTLTDPASAGEIASGKEVIDQNGAVMTGTMPSNPAISETLEAGESYQVPAGYTPGGTVQAASLASQTPGTATQDDIIQGQTAWVNGVQVTGALEPGSDTSDATATTADILAPQTAYVATGKVEGTMPTRTADDVTIQNTTINVASGYYAPNTTKEIQTVEQATPSISVSAGGLITATSEQTAGFVAEGTKSATQQLPVQGAQTITPGTTQQTINSGVYLTGAQTIQGDPDLVPDNIKQDVEIFGVVGTYGGGAAPGAFSAPLIVTVDAGATVTAKNGDITLTEISDGTAEFILTSGGDWLIQATLNDLSSNTVTIHVQAEYTTELTLEAKSVIKLDSISLNSSSYGYGNSSAASISNHALFAGGDYAVGNGASQRFFDTVYCIDESLTRSTITSLPSGKGMVSGGENSNYAGFFGGRSTASNSLATACSYDISLTQSELDNLSNGTRQPRTATFNGNICVIPGLHGGANINVYDLSKTHTTPAQMSSYKQYGALASTTGYLLIGGGYYNSYLDSVESFDSSFIRAEIDPLSTPRSNLCGVSFAGKVLFAGGTSGTSQYSDVVDIYDESLTHTIGQNLSTGFRSAGGTTLPGYALIADCGGSDYTVNLYNESLTMSVADPLDGAPSSLNSFTSFGNYAFVRTQYAANVYTVE